MKIGLVLPNLPAYSETFFRNKIMGLQQNGHEVILFVNSKPKTANYLDCKIVHAPKLGGNKLKRAIGSLTQILKAIFVHPRKSLHLYKLNRKDGISFKENLKLIIANQFLLTEKLDWLHFGFGTMALGRENIAQVIGAKMAVSFRGFDYYVYPIKNKNCYNTLFSKEVKYHVLSDAMKKGLINKGVLKENIIKITPAIDIELFEKTELPNNKIVQLTTVSRLHPIKGLDYILEALALLKQENISFHFSIMGDGSEKERLQFTVYQLGLLENVSFLGKLVPEQVKEELSKSDIYLQYSVQEGFCNAVLEAQAMGLLCIVSDAEGLSENVLDRQTGWVVAKRNPALLAEKIKEVSKLNKICKNDITDKAIQRIKNNFNIEKQTQKFVAFYKQ